MKRLLYIAMILMFLPLVKAQGVDITRLYQVNPYENFPQGGCHIPKIKISSAFPMAGWKLVVDEYTWGAFYKSPPVTQLKTIEYDLQPDTSGVFGTSYMYTVDYKKTNVNCGPLRIKLVDNLGRTVTFITAPAVSDYGYVYTINLDYPTNEVVNTTGCPATIDHICYKNSFSNVYVGTTSTKPFPGPGDTITIDVQGVFENPNDLYTQVRLWKTDEGNFIKYNGDSKIYEPTTVVPSTDYSVSVVSDSEGDVDVTIHYTMPNYYGIVKSCVAIWKHGTLFSNILNMVCTYIGSGEVNKDKSYVYVTPEFIDLNQTNEDLIIEGKVSFNGAFMGYSNYSIVKFHNENTGENKYFMLWHSYLEPEHVYQLMINSGLLKQYLGVGKWKISVLYYNPFCANTNGLDGCYEEIRTGGEIYGNTEVQLTYVKPSNLYGVATFNGTTLHVEAYFTDNETGEPITGAICTVNPVLEVAEGQYSGLGIFPLTHYNTEKGYYYEDINLGSFDKDYTLHYRIDCDADRGQYYYTNTYVGEVIVRPVASYGYQQLISTGTIFDIVFQSNILYIIFAAGLGAAASHYNKEFGFFMFIAMLVVLTALNYVSILYTLPITILSLALFYMYRK